LRFDDLKPCQIDAGRNILRVFSASTTQSEIKEDSMKSTFKAHSTHIIGIIALVAVMGFTLTGCPIDGGGGNDEGEKKGKESVAGRWSKWVDPSSTATLTYSVADDGVCTITVGGTAESDIWKTSSRYSYTAKANTNYKYTFEAWTESDARYLWVQYYEDNDESVWLGSGVSITTTRKTYTVWGQDLPKDREGELQFQCANQLGTFYIKILEIKEFKIGKLTITNFSGNPGLTQDNWIAGVGNFTVNNRYLLFSSGVGQDDNGTFVYPKQITGSSIILPVWIENQNNFTVAPFTGNVTVEEGHLYLSDYGEEEWDYVIYQNKVPIIFTNGNATIDFGTQMEIWQIP